MQNLYFSPKREKRIKRKIRKVLKSQERKDEIDKLVKAWKRISESEGVSFSEFMDLVDRVVSEEIQEK